MIDIITLNLKRAFKQPGCPICRLRQELEQDDKTMSLNQSQSTAVSTTLLHLERALDEIERLLDGPAPSITYTTEMNLAPATTQQIRERCAAIRRETAEMMERFELPLHHWYGRQVIAAEMTSAWTNLEEVRPERLRRFGAVDPTLYETLTPRLERLIQLVRAIQNLASRGTDT